MLCSENNFEPLINGFHKGIIGEVDDDDTQMIPHSRATCPGSFATWTLSDPSTSTSFAGLTLDLLQTNKGGELLTCDDRYFARLRAMKKPMAPKPMKPI